MSPRHISANLLLSADSKAVLNGSSRALSFPADRERFLTLRKSANLIVIGGNTARNESYLKTPCDLAILSHRHEESFAQLLQTNARARVHSLDFEELLDRVGDKYAEIDVEAGPTLLLPALEKGLIDTLYLSLAKNIGDPTAPAYKWEKSLDKYHLASYIAESDGELRTYQLVPSAL